MQDALDTAKEEFNKKFEEKTRAERKVFSFDSEIAPTSENTDVEASEMQII